MNTTNILPPTPDVTALGKFLSMPVSYSTGVPEISLPVYTVQSGDLSLPISLSYNASGIKVEESPTWVGLGWNLQAGGSISRVVRGLPDDLTAIGYMNTSTTVRYIDSLPYDSDEKFNIYENQIGQNILDVEPDIFMFSIMGYSGRFYFDQTARQFILSPNQNIKLSYQTDLNNNIINWIITLPNGIKCYFGNSVDGSRPVVEQSGVTTNYTLTNGTLGSGTAPVGAHNTSWPIVQIIAPSGRSIDFYYFSLSASDFGRSSETMEYDMDGGSCLVSIYQSDKRQTVSFYKHAYSKPLLNRISSDICDVKFIASTSSRLDMAGDDRSLDTIVVKDKSNKTIKRFDLTYGYFTATDSLPLNPIPVSNSIVQKRLYLSSFTETNDDHSISLPYNLTYNTSVPLPNRLSASQDYWGFYNGKNNGEFLAPKVSVAAVRGLGSGYESGADRTVDPTLAQAGILTKIHYPTGGTISYTYESNRALAGFAGPELDQFQVSGLSPRAINIGNGTQSPTSVDGDPSHPTQHYVDTFTVSNIVGQAQLSVNCDGCGSTFSTLCPLNGSIITGLTDPNFSTIIGENFTTFIDLPNGQYRLELKITPNSTYPSPNYSFSLNWSENADLYSMLMGGLRIKSIASDDSVGNKLNRSYTYTLFSDPSHSSGNVYNLPTTLSHSICGGGLGNVSRVQSTSALPVYSIDGNLIRYTNITEYLDTAHQTYKTEYTFSIDELFDQEAYNTNYPAASPVQSDWRAGLLKEKKDYELLNGSDYRVLRDEQYTYSSFAGTANTDFGIKIAPYDNGSHGNEGSELFGITPYSFKTEWYLPDSTYTAEYSYQPGNPQPIINAHSTKNYYNAHYFVNLTRRTNSKGEVIDERSWYPFDYSNISGFNFTQLTTNGILESPVKQEISNNGKITSGRVIKHNSQGKPIAVYDYENNQPSDTLSFDNSVVLTPWYQPKTSIGYDSYYNINQVIPQFDYSTLYIWDYTGNYPIAQAKNTGADVIAYTSFESDGTGNWTIPDTARNRTSSMTGANSYNISSGKTISKSGLTAATTYIISYWSTSGSLNVGGTTGMAGITVGAWTYYEHTITGTTSISITGTATIDELRLFPKGSLMTTFTYAPLIGMTSQCSPTNYITYYTYDGLRRLAGVKDLRGNIIKTVNYNYHH